MWYKDAIFYELNVRAFCDSNGDGHGDLPGLLSKLDYLQELGVTCLWLLPMYPSPLKDNGYDIANFYGIDPLYGTLEDFKKLLNEAHQRGMRIIMDLVMNHTSDEHPWFIAARTNPKSEFRDYYVWSDSDQKFKDARIIFLDTETSNWAWDEESQQYYWHRFFSSQPELNYNNPVVQEEMRKIISFWLDLGVDGYRCDGVPYLFEEEGTSCENLPQTHDYFKKLRKYIDEHYPGRILLAEANQWPEDVLPYFGDGSDEFHMAFHFPIMPRFYLALRKADRTPLEWIMGRTPDLSESSQWCIFLRNHDELTLEMVTEEERQFLWEEYAPDPRMRLNLGIRRRLAPLLDNDIRKIALFNSMLFTFPGSPIVYYGDEIGMGDNIWLHDRNGVRTPMQWDDSPNAGFSSAPNVKLYEAIIDDPEYNPQSVNVAASTDDPHSIYNRIRHMIAVRKQYKVFGWGDFQWLEPVPKAVAAYSRSCQEERLLVFNNLSDEAQDITLAEDASRYSDILTGQFIPPGPFTLQPYQYLWLIPEE